MIGYHKKIENKLKEKWLSGRKRQIANLLYEYFHTEGSNPSFSVCFKTKSLFFSFFKEMSLSQRMIHKKRCQLIQVQQYQLRYQQAIMEGVL